MFNKLVKKYKLNIDGMLKNGTVAVITMFSIGILFGVKNIMLAFPIALTSAVLGRQNFYVKPISKILNIIIVDLIIVLTAYLSSINLWVGIPINLISIFLIIYVVTSPYDPTFYKPFIMLYIFTQYANVSIKELPSRVLAVIVGVLIIAICSFIKKGNEKLILIKMIKNALTIIRKQLIYILKGGFDVSLTVKCSNLMMDLAYRIYITRYRKYLTTNLGTVQFEVFMYLEELNLHLKDVYERYIEGSIYKKQIEECLFIIDSLQALIANKKNEKDIVERINNLKIKSKKEDKEIIKLIGIIDGLSQNMIKLMNISFNDQNRVYKQWQRSNLDKPIVLFKEYFNKDSIRFKFAIRMSITLTFALFIGELLGFYKVIWAIITIMSIMQPYYEDTISKAKERVIGNILAIIITGIFINLVNNKIITIILLVISLYLLYGFKEYYKISLFAGIASICVASLSENINTLIAYRVAYVIVGVMIVLLANKYIFPYKLKIGIEQLKSKIIRYNLLLIEESNNYIKGNENTYVIRDLVIHITLLCQKLYLRNLQYNDNSIKEFINKNNELVIDLGYNILEIIGKNNK